MNSTQLLVSSSLHNPSKHNVHHGQQMMYARVERRRQLFNNEKYLNSDRGSWNENKYLCRIFWMQRIKQFKKVSLLLDGVGSSVVGGGKWSCIMSSWSSKSSSVTISVSVAQRKSMSICQPSVTVQSSTWKYNLNWSYTILRIRLRPRLSYSEGF